MTSRNAIPPALRAELEGTDWRVENGGKHLKLIVNGRLCGILSRGYTSEMKGKAMLNTRAQIRRAKKEKRT